MPAPTLLAVSHGTSSADGQRAVAALADAVAARLPGVPVRLGHVDVQQPDVAAALAAIEGAVVVVPLLLSAGYHVRVDLRRALAERADVALAPALGPDPRLATVLAERLGPVPPDAEVLLAVAGSSDERANEDCRTQATMLADRLGRPVATGFLAAAEPRLADAAARLRHPLVSAYLLAPGYFHDVATRDAGGARVSPPLLLPGDTPAPIVDIVVERYAAEAAALASRV